MASTRVEATTTRRRKSALPVDDGLDAGTLPVPRSRARERQSTTARKTSRGRRQHQGHDDEHDHEHEHTNDAFWLDGPLALTLLPPLGSFLTGGDWLRDGLVLALLFYYLRALIKTPWELYLKARARRPPPSMQLESDEDLEPEHIRKIRDLARSELRLAEIAYLGLCLLTPFLGVLLLRWGASLLGADTSLTWFSTGLFTLATGLRPWRHLVQLIVTRTDSLHDIVHHPLVIPPEATRLSTEGLDAVGAERLDAIHDALEELRTAHDRQVAKQERALAGVTQTQRAQAQKHQDALVEAQGKVDEHAVALAAAREEIQSHMQTLAAQVEAQAQAAAEAAAAAAAANAAGGDAPPVSPTASSVTAGPTISEIQAILARLEESIEHLEATSRNNTRATELVRLESTERASSLTTSIASAQASLEALSTKVEGLSSVVDNVSRDVEGVERDVTEVKARVGSASAGVTAASAVAGDAMDMGKKAEENAGVARTLAGEAATAAGKAREGIQLLGQQIEQLQAQVQLQAQAQVQTQARAGRKGSSLAWNPPRDAVDPSSPVSPGNVDANTWNIASALSSEAAQQAYSTGREISPSGRRRRQTASTSPARATTINTNPSSTSGAAARKAQEALTYARSTSPLVDSLIHWGIQVLLVPVKLSQVLLHRVIAVLGVAAEPRSAGPTAANVMDGTGLGSELQNLLSPKGKGQTLTL
ncbi:hypothetical protein DL93DRAFT_2069970 [Clavulina sp. PMI_390]|nr:hypothetical protein DL93DRAFT_2069970 [Clavulina sp. PMI_390]